MKKISIITIFDVNNFGTYLQVLALGKTLQSKGFNVEVIKYIRPIHTWIGEMRMYLSRNILKVLYRFFFRVPLIFLTRRRHHLFIKKYLSVSRKYSSFEALKKNPPMADIYLTGSDQVWNSYYNGGLDRSYFLDFIPSGKDKFAYSASIGMNDFSENEKSATKELLSQYKSISVREQQAKQILENLGLRNVQVVLDPTLLLTKNDWLKLVDISAFKKKEPYLLIYSVEGKSENELIKDISLRIVKNKRLSVYSVFNGKNQPNLNFVDKYFTYATLPVFLSLFAQADFVVVSSFHGTAFSINMNKNFITVAPPKFNSRVDNILNICGLQERKISDINSFSDKLLDNIDYYNVNKILADEREKSMNFIKKIM